MPDDSEDQGVLRRMDSFALSKSELEIFVVNKDGSETLLEQADFDDIEPLGGGNQGKIFAAKVLFKNESGEDEVRHCVLKHIPKKRNAAESAFEAHAQISEQDKTSTENNVIKLIKLVEHEGEQFALLPYCDLFLEKAIDALRVTAESDPEKFESLKIPLALHVLSDLSEAFISLHLDKNYVHGDVKPANVALNRGHWVLIDLDCAKKTSERVDYYSGTVAFAHPSAIHDRNNASHPATDLFALGEIILAIFQQSFTFHSDREAMEVKDSLYRRALREKYGDSVEQKPFAEIIRDCATIEEKIMAIAFSLTQPLASNQADILEIKKCVDELKANLFSARDASEVGAELNQFYDELKSDGYFSATENTALPPPKEYPAARPSLCPSALFSSTAKRKPASDENLNAQYESDSDFKSE